MATKSTMVETNRPELKETERIFDENSVSDFEKEKDEEINYLFVEILLTEKIDLKCNVLHAKDGKEAIEIIDR